MSNNYNSIKCIKCGLVNFGTENECKRCGTPIDSVTLLANKQSRFEYKILTQKDSFFRGGRFDGEMLEAALNEYSNQGWRVISATTASIHGLTSRDEIVIIMEKEKR